MAKNSLHSSDSFTQSTIGSNKQGVSKSEQPNHSDQHALRYKERYKHAKALLRVAEKKHLEAEEELCDAKLKILQLQRQQNDFLNQLAKNSSAREVSTKVASTTSGHTLKRSLKPYEFLPRASLPSTPSKKTKKMQRATESSTPKQKKPRQKRDLEKPRRVQPIPLNDDGTFALPIQISIFTVVSLGVVDYKRPSFHSCRYIMPIGFKVLRYYRSTIDPEAQTCYTSSIIDGISGPKFQVVAEDRPKEPFLSDSPSGAWTQILKQASKVRNLQVANSGSGPEYYGLAHPTIAYMIQSLPDAKLCSNYHWQNFDVQPLNPAQSRPWAAPPVPGTSSNEKDAPLATSSPSISPKLDQPCDGLESSDRETGSPPK